MPLTGAIVPRSTAVTVSTTAAQAIAANPGRNGLILINLSGANTISIIPGSIPGAADPVPTSLGAGTLTLPVSSTTIIGGATIPWTWTASIIAIASAGTALLTILEF